MPALPNVSKVIRLDFQFQLTANVLALSRQFWHYSGTAPTPSDILVFADNAVASFAGTCVNDFASDFTFLGCEATDLSSPSSAQAISPVTVAGGNGGSVLAQDICFVCAYQIGRRYRGGHPRGYWPFGTDNDVGTETTWDPTSVDQWVSDLASTAAGIAAGGWSGAGTITQVSVSYFHGFTVVTSPTTGRARNVPTLRAVPVQDAVVNYEGRLIYGNQRRRLGR